jgi:hypothetical protein
MAQQKIFGYANRISVRPGEEISFHVNCDGATEADAQLVRLIHGDTGEAGPGHVEVEVDSPVNGRWAVKKQFTQLGSFLKFLIPKQTCGFQRLFARGFHLADAAAARQPADDPGALGYGAQRVTRTASTRPDISNFGWGADSSRLRHRRTAVAREGLVSGRRLL